MADLGVGAGQGARPEAGWRERMDRDVDRSPGRRLEIPCAQKLDDGARLRERRVEIHLIPGVKRGALRRDDGRGPCEMAARLRRLEAGLDERPAKMRPLGQAARRAGRGPGAYGKRARGDGEERLES